MQASLRKITGLPLIYVFCTICFLQACATSVKEGPLLDGQTFTVITVPVGNNADAALERISFNASRFDNDNCHLWGFGDAPYTAMQSGDSIRFKASTSSQKEGMMIWNGTVVNGVLSGTMVWIKEGQSDLQYNFSSENIEMVDLNGKQFEVEFTPGDSSTREVITFAKGQFESPGCYAWGFSAAPYQAYMLDGQTHFQSLYTSEKEGKMLFYGVIDKGVVTGTQFWTKEGQADMYYMMRGKAL